MEVRLATLIGAIFLSSCAAVPPPEPAPYLASYRPLTPRPGELIAYPTAALDGRLEVVGGCFVVVSDGGAPTLVAFPPRVGVVKAEGRWGLRDAKGRRRVLQGERIGVGGSSHATPERFITDRFTSPPPPPACPKALFISNFGFETP